MQTSNILIRNATPNDVELIAWAFLTALGLESEYSTKQSEIFPICLREDTIYSWKRSRIACLNGQPAGCLISYPGTDYERLRESTWQLFDDFWQNDNDHFEPETYAGEYYLDTLAVLPTYRQKGVAKALLLDGVQRGQALNCDRVTLIAESDNPHLLRYYQDIGFEKLSEMNFFGHLYTRMSFRK